MDRTSVRMSSENTGRNISCSENGGLELEQKHDVNDDGDDF